MTEGERSDFRVAVQGCWVRDPGSEADRTTVVVAFQLGRDGRVVGEVTKVSDDAASPTVATVAFQAARRAIMRCQADGFRLPPEKFEQWRRVLMTFNAGGTIR